MPSIVGHKNHYAFSVKLLGLMLDVVGSIMVAVSLVNLNHHVQNIHSKKSLDLKAKEELQEESHVTIIGIIFIAVGFALIFGEEVVSSVKW